MKPIIIPDDYNYIGVFLTLRCNLNCPYCITRQGEFHSPEELSTTGWIEGLSRIATRPDLPLSIQGGEPTIHPGFYQLMNHLHYNGKHLDLLTNGTFDTREFFNHMSSEVFKREAKYASIRFSYHTLTHISMLYKVSLMQNNDYEVGVWGVNPPGHDDSDVSATCKWLNIDYRRKEYLGTHKGHTYGTFKYPQAVSGKPHEKVWCKPSELLIGPGGFIYRCHADLYSQRNFVGHILDNEITFGGFQECQRFGYCNFCDVKIKTNRLQEYGHTSVTIKGKGVKENIGAITNYNVQVKGDE